MVEHYRGLIMRGDLKDGDRLPSARQLVGLWGISHATAAKVLSTLRAEGLVETVSGGGGGTTVRVGDMRQIGYTPQDRMLSVRNRGRIYPPGEQARINAAELVAAPERVADAMGVESGTVVIRRRRVTYRDETPVSASTSWFAGDLASIAPLLLVPERILEGTPGYIVRVTGRPLGRGSDQIAADIADESTAAELASRSRGRSDRVRRVGLAPGPMGHVRIRSGLTAQNSQRGPGRRPVPFSS